MKPFPSSLLLLAGLLGLAAGTPSAPAAADLHDPSPTTMPNPADPARQLPEITTLRWFDDDALDVAALQRAYDGR